MLSEIIPKKRVVIVEDDVPTLERLVSEIQGSTHYEVFNYADSVESFFEKNISTKFEILLLDIRLPGKSGIEGLVKIKDKYPEVEVIMLTVIDDQEKIFQSFRLGAVGYVLKSDIETSIVEYLDIINGGGSLISPLIARRIVQYFNPTRKIRTLNAKEEAVLKLMAEGTTYEEVAKQLDLSIDMVRYYVKKIYGKLHVNNKIEAIRKYLHFIND